MPPRGTDATAFLVVAVSVVELLPVEFSALVGLPVGLLAGGKQCYSSGRDTTVSTARRGTRWTRLLGSDSPSSRFRQSVTSISMARKIGITEPMTVRPLRATDPGCPAVGPSDVLNGAGRVDSLAGQVSGQVEWDVSEEGTLTVVVHTWDPENEWVEVRRFTRTVEDDGSLTLEELLGSRQLTYADGPRARAFSNPKDGTTQVRRGYVSVTAFVPGDDGVRRSSAMDPFTFSVTNVESFDESSEPDLTVSSPGLLNVSGVAPGQSGSGEAVVANDGDAAGNLDVVLESIESRENGLTEPERDVDRPGNGGELAGNLSVRVYVLSEDGSRTYAVGGPDSFVSLASLESGALLENYRLNAGESVRVRAEWRVPPSTGNAIQSDAVAVNVSYVLTST